MACPYFEPVAKFEDRAWSIPPRLPLGGSYSGVCHAPYPETRPPDAEISRELCNMGYARGRCRCFPADASADAVRFSVLGEADGVLSVQYILEKEYFPLEYGVLEYAASSGGFRESIASGPMLRQALRFVENHLSARVTA